MPIAVGAMLAMQGAGMVIDYLGKQSSIDLAKEGQRLQEEAIKNSITQLKIQTADESTRAMIDLRKNLGTQAALFAARGIRGGSPTTITAANESIGNFNADERMRKINELVNETRLKAGLELSQLHEQTFENQQWNDFTGSLIKKIPTSPEAYKQIGESFGLTSVGS